MQLFLIGVRKPLLCKSLIDNRKSYIAIFILKSQHGFLIFTDLFRIVLNNRINLTVPHHRVTHLPSTRVNNSPQAMISL